MSVFKINEFISLKLDGANSVIYIKNERFLICKHILININQENTETLSKIDSIDDAIEKINRENNYVEFKIDSKTEFWGHCSNLQAWAENDYDTRILHRNLAFPLLEKLTHAGDKKAKRVFKEEIVKRIESGNLSVALFLIIRSTDISIY